MKYFKCVVPFNKLYSSALIKKGCFTLLMILVLLTGSSNSLSSQVEISSTWPDEVYPCDTFYLDITVINNSVEILNDLEMEIRGVNLASPLPEGVKVVHTNLQDYTLSLPSVSSCDSIVLSIPLFADCSNNSGQVLMHSQFSSSGVFLFSEDHQIQVLPFQLQVFLPQQFDVNDSVNWFTHTLILSNTGFGSIRELWIRPKTEGDIYEFDSLLGKAYIYDSDLIKLEGSAFNNSGNGDLLLDRGESIGLKLKWLISQCGEDVVSFDIMIPCNGEICFQSQIISTSQTFQLFQPDPRQTFLTKHIGIKEKDTTSIEITNPAKIHSKENAIYDLSLIIENKNDIALDKGRIHIDSVVIGEFTFPVYQINADSINPVYALDFYNALTFDPDGATNGLADLDGDGYYDDLPPGSGVLQLGFINNIEIEKLQNESCDTTLNSRFTLFDPVMHYNNFCTKGTFPQTESIGTAFSTPNWSRGFPFIIESNLSDEIIFDEEEQKVSFQFKEQFQNFLENCEASNFDLTIKDLPIQYLASDTIFVTTRDTSYSVPVVSDSTYIALEVESVAAGGMIISFYAKRNCDSIFFDMHDPQLSVCQNCNLVNNLKNFTVEVKLQCDPDNTFNLNCKEYALPIECDSVASQPVDLLKFSPTEIYRLSVGWKDSTLSEKVNPFVDDISHTTAFIYDTLQLISKFNYICDATCEYFEISFEDGSGDGFELIDPAVSYFSSQDNRWYDYGGVYFNVINTSGTSFYILRSNDLVNPMGGIQILKGDSLKIEYKLRVENLNVNEDDSDLSVPIIIPSILLTTDKCDEVRIAPGVSVRIIDYEVYNPLYTFHHMDMWGNRFSSGISGTPILPCEPIFCGAIKGFPAYFHYGAKSSLKPIALKNEWRYNISIDKLQFSFKDIADYVDGSFGIYKLEGWQKSISDSLSLIKELDENNLIFSNNNGIATIELENFSNLHDSVYRQNLYFIGFYIKNECFSGVEDLGLEGAITRSYQDKDMDSKVTDTLEHSFDYHIRGINAVQKPNSDIIYINNRTPKKLKYRLSVASLNWTSPVTNFYFPFQFEIGEEYSNFIKYAIHQSIFPHPTDSIIIYRDTSASSSVYISKKTTRNPYLGNNNFSFFIRPEVCQRDTLLIKYLTRCYEKSTEPDYCEDYILTDTFIVVPQLPAISASINNSISNQVLLCDTFTAEFSFRNTGYATIYENELLLLMPDFVTLNSLKYEWGENNGIAPLNDSYFIGNTLHIPLDSAKIDTLPGVHFGNNNTFILQAKFIVECSDQSSFSISGLLKGEAPCGDNIVSNSAIFKPIFIKEDNQSGEFNMDLSSKFQNICTDTAELIVTVNSPESRSGKEFVDIEFPLGFEYVPNSTMGIYNFVAHEPVSDISLDGYKIRWQLSTYNSGDTSIQFKFKVINFCRSGCNSPPVIMAIGDSIPSFCNSTCNAIISLGQEVFDPFYFKPAIKAIEISSSSVNREDSISSILNFEIIWLGKAFDSTLLHFNLVEDVNGDAVYDAADRIIGRYSRLWTLQNGLDSIIFNFGKDYSCGFILVLDQRENPCICTQHQIHFTVSTLREEFVCKGEEVKIGVGNACSYTIVKGGQSANLQNDTLYYMINQYGFADTILINKRCGSGCERMDTFIFYSNEGLLELNLVQGILCAGDSSGIISLTVNGIEEDSLDINWNHDPVTKDLRLENLPAGLYFSTVEWQNCQWADTITLIDPDSLYGSVDYKKTGCDPLSPYIAWLTSKGGTPPYEVLIDGNKVRDSAEVGIGQHEFKVIDSAGCEYTYLFTIVDSSGQFEVESLSATCKGVKDGVIIIEGSPFQYILINDSIQSFEPIIDHMPAGLHSIVIYDENQCPYYFQTTIPAGNEISLHLEDTITAIFNEEVELVPTIAPVSVYSYNWRPPHLFECLDCPNNSLITGTEAITVYLTVKDSAGCVAHDTVEIIVNDKANIFIPNTFTPNDDGVNDGFGVIGKGFAFNRLQIFDRWGEKLFESEDQFNNWDGTFLGQKVPTGVYVYKFEYVSSNGEIRSLTGSITVVR